MASLNSSTPRVIANGIDDQSVTSSQNTQDQLPTHLPWIYLFTKQGRTTPQLVFGASRTNMYHADSFDYRKPWANHGTVLSNLVNSAPNAQFIQRLRPTDAVIAGVQIWIDVLHNTQVDDYQRNADGSYFYDTNNQLVKMGSINGNRVKFIAKHLNQNVDLGSATSKAGTMTDASGNTSTMYPWIEWQADSFGAEYSNYGIRMWAPTEDSTPSIDTSILVDENKAYPFKMQLVYRDVASATTKPVTSIGGDTSIDVCFKPKAFNIAKDKKWYAGDVFVQAYQDLEPTDAPPTWGAVGAMHIYQSNLDDLLTSFYVTEIPVKGAFSDFDAINLPLGQEQYRFNFLTGVSSSSVPYHSYALDTTSADAIVWGKNNTIYLMDGADGTMNDTVYDTLVRAAMADWIDENAVVQDDAKYPASVIYDTGFTLETKYALLNAISLRKDMKVVLGTAVAGAAPLSASEDSSVCLALLTHARNFPESETYGTGACRALIFGRSGILINSQYEQRLPLTFEYAVKSALYQGASNGKWKDEFNFDSGDNAVITLFRDINVTFTGAKVRNKDWTNAMNYVQSKGLRTYFFPAIRTVRADETSILVSPFNVDICIECTKVGFRAWRQFSGTSSLTDAELITEVNKYITDNTVGRFGDRSVKIVPHTYFTDSDVTDGFRWTLEINVYGPNQKTVETLKITTRRISEYSATTA